MLNKNGERELAYVVLIDVIEPIQGSDNCECAVIGGWHVMVRKGEFCPGDPAIYFEIDSKLDADNPAFAFMASKKYRVKTQKYTFGGKGNFISQGLVMSADNFGWTVANPCNHPHCQSDNCNTCNHSKLCIVDDKGNHHYANDESRFLTKCLNITYYVVEDNDRKAPSVDKYQKMINRNPDLMKNRFFRWLYKRSFGKKILFFFFGKKNVRVWPEWVSKTDEERVQNMPWILKNKDPWIVTEKIDGSSATYTMKRGPAKYLWNIPKNEFYVCSRNVVFETPDKPCFYTNNIYWEIAEKYHIKNVLEDILREHPEWDWVTIQGEIYGPKVQKRDYSKKEHDFAAFNFITSKTGRLNSIKARGFIGAYGIPWVPILYGDYILPDSVDQLLAAAEGNSVIDGGPREGWVLRAQDGGQSFKAVSNSFLLKFH